jgi:thioredoxin reductase (NADPH)
MVRRAEKDPKISFAWNSAVTEIHGADHVEGITLTNTLDGTTRELAISGLFIAIGHDPRSELLHGQVRLDEEGYVLTEQGSSRTNLPGVFAAGDLVDRTYRQAITAAGSGCAAALDAERYLADLDDVGDPVIAQAEAALMAGAGS